MRNLFISTLIGALGLLGLQACSDSNGNDKTAGNPATTLASVSADSVRLTTRQLDIANVSLVNISSRALKPIIYANGTITLLPDSKAEVSSHIQGKIEQIYVREGQSVRKGQPLARLSSFQLLELQNDYAAARSDVEFLQAEFKRQDELRKSNIGVLADFQATDAKLKAAIARERVLKSKLDLLGVSAGRVARDNVTLTTSLVIRSPINGFVYKFHENIGSTLDPGTLLAEIINPNRIQADVFVYEKDAPYVREGQPVELTFPNAPGKPVMGRVAYISRSIDNDNRAITLHVNFSRPQSGQLLLADMNVQARIIGAGERVSTNTLPRTAILDDGEGKFVFMTNRAGTDTIPFRKQKVEILNEGEDFVEIRPVGKVPADVKIANNNVLALEAERKKRE